MRATNYKFKKNTRKKIVICLERYTCKKDDLK